MWCQIFPDQFFESKEIKRIGIDALLRLQYNIDHSDEVDKEFTFHANSSQMSLSYQEALFKLSWKLAQSTRQSQDISQALRCLAGLSGKSGLDEMYSSASSSNEADVLIEYARSIREVDENKHLKEQIKQLTSPQTKTSHVGMFKQTNTAPSAEGEVVVRKKLQRKLSL